MNDNFGAHISFIRKEMWFNIRKVSLDLIYIGIEDVIIEVNEEHLIYVKDVSGFIEVGKVTRRNNEVNVKNKIYIEDMLVQEEIYSFDFQINGKDTADKIDIHIRDLIFKQVIMKTSNKEERFGDLAKSYNIELFGQTVIFLFFKISYFI